MSGKTGSNWSVQGKDNILVGHPLELCLYIPPETGEIRRAGLSLRLLPFLAGDSGGPTASRVTVSINGVDCTEVLGGPFDADRDVVDIRPHLKTYGWNDIEIGTAAPGHGLGRVAAAVFVEVEDPPTSGDRK